MPRVQHVMIFFSIEKEKMTFVTNFRQE